MAGPERIASPAVAHVLLKRDKSLPHDIVQVLFEQAVRGSEQCWEWCYCAGGAGLAAAAGRACSAVAIAGLELCMERPVAAAAGWTRAWDADGRGMGRWRTEGGPVCRHGWIAIDDLELVRVRVQSLKVADRQDKVE